MSDEYAPARRTHGWSDRVQSRRDDPCRGTESGWNERRHRQWRAWVKVGVLSTWCESYCATRCVVLWYCGTVVLWYCGIVQPERERRDEEAG